MTLQVANADAELDLLAPAVVRATHARIDLDAIAENVRIIKRNLTPGTSLIAVVKANGYGHGSTMVGRSALDAGADALAVATVDEARVLRRNGVASRIVVLGPVFPGEFEAVVSLEITLAVADAAAIRALDAVAGAAGRAVDVQLKIDTGMNRFGCDSADAPALARLIADAAHLRLGGVFTHFAEADAETPDSARMQARRFDDALLAIAAAGIDVPMRHAANSAATLRTREFDYDAIRLGIAMYGLAPSEFVPLLDGMRQSMTIHSRVARVHELQAGDAVSYGATYRATRSERVALIPCGYADGYSRSLSNRGFFASGATRLPIRGRVCMDQTIAGIPDGFDLDLGDSVTLIGDGRDAAPTIDDIAQRIGTINYEVATSIAARVPRVYLRGGEVVAIEDLSGLHSL